MMTPIRPWPRDEATAERQAAAYLPLQGTKSTLLPQPWPQQDPGFSRTLHGLAFPYAVVSVYFGRS